MRSRCLHALRSFLWRTPVMAPARKTSRRCVFLLFNFFPPSLWRDIGQGWVYMAGLWCRMMLRPGLALACGFCLQLCMCTVYIQSRDTPLLQMLRRCFHSWHIAVALLCVGFQMSFVPFDFRCASRFYISARTLYARGGRGRVITPGFSY